ncbi:phosphopyruvate hydratase [Ollibium composti]|uniref:Enolase n=1 Tax=Ollibium composti TaxID=2675109 RepID=A0ABY2QBJ4_9HYPH|nr:phosphopyruvate hydratase [Mesorhizobium composti]THF58183.1 phosphopyruvate hydratase [Mesorhizobium composti]
MKHQIETVSAQEILDSRGNPTIHVTVSLTNGVIGQAAVPSGASTGENEAVELRDGDKNRFGGKGVLKAIAAVEGEIASAVAGLSALDQAAIDGAMIALDGTPNKTRLGANAILGVSMAAARVAASSLGLPLWSWLGGCGARRLPMPMMNVINGGAHADNGLDMQEFMIVPVGASSFAEAVRFASETFHALKALLHERGLSVSVGDEGGFAPRLSGNDQACEVIVEAIEKAGYEPGKDIAIALDPAANSMWRDGHYELRGAKMLTSNDMTALYGRWIDRFPIISIEDGLAEHDWEGFAAHTAALGDRVQVVGDDLYVTNVQYIETGIRRKATNAVLIKLNQIGTVTETIAAVDVCRSAGWGYVISHRSGETEDAFIADFAVAMGGGQIKAGAPSRGERTAKYNRLMAIERALGDSALFANPFASRGSGEANSG